MNKILNKALPVAVLLIIMAAGCTINKSPAPDPKDMSYIYNPLNNPINPEIRVVNETDNKSVVLVRLRSSDLFFSEANPSGEPLASITVTARLYNNTQGGILADTSRIRMNYNRNYITPEIIVDIPLTTYDGFEYTVEIRIMDNLNRRIVQSFTRFDRLSPYSRYNYRIRDYETGMEVFSPVVTKNNHLNVLYKSNPDCTLFVFCYSYFDIIPYPPSMMLPERTLPIDPDSVIKVTLSDTTPLVFPQKGIYMCSIDSSVIEGYTLFNFGDEYPLFSRAESMIEPLAYIATPEEMASMRSTEKAKLAVDAFWLARSTNIEKSRELLRIYYNRVKYANLYFTSYKEGWRTDRGMIYIIYGPPDKVYKNREGEQWGYKKPVIKKSWGMHYTVSQNYLWFSFNNNANRFSTEDYYLNRSDATPTHWDRAVSDWRKGVVFRLDNPEDL